MNQFKKRITNNNFEDLSKIYNFIACIYTISMLVLVMVKKTNLTESKQSIFIKKFIISTKLKEVTLNNVKKNKKFLESKNEQKTPPKKKFNKYDVEESITEGRNVYTISPKNKSTEKIILYLHGGAYMANFQSIHWNFISNIIDGAGIKVVAPDYPLAPEHTWQDAFYMLNSLYKKLNLEKKDFILIGDSAGAGLALAWTIELYNKNYKQPGQLFLLSPWLDVSMSNPDIVITEDIDPYLSREALKIAGKYWSGDTETDSWQVSPLNNDFKVIPPLTLFTGTADILNNDAQLLKNRILTLGLNIDYREYKNMIHDWMFFKMPEAKKCCDEIISIINMNIKN